MSEILVPNTGVQTPVVRGGFQSPPGVEQILHFGRIGFKKQSNVPTGTLPPGLIQQTAVRYGDAQAPPHEFMVKWGMGEFFTFANAEEFAAFYSELYNHGALVSTGSLLRNAPRKEDMQWYEVIREEKPCFWMNDVEYVLPEGDPTAVKRYRLLGDWLWALLGKLGAPQDVLGDLRVLNGTRSKGDGLIKHSFHILLRSVIAQDTETLKRLFVGVGRQLIREWDVETLPLFFYDEPIPEKKHKTGNDTIRSPPSVASADDPQGLWMGRMPAPVNPHTVQRKCIIDFGVYSRNRAMRVLGSIKDPSKEKRWEALWPQSPMDEDALTIPQGRVIKVGQMTPNDVLQYLYTSISFNASDPVPRAWRLRSEEMKARLKELGLVDPCKPKKNKSHKRRLSSTVHPVAAAGDVTGLIGIEHKIPFMDNTPDNGAVAGDGGALRSFDIRSQLLRLVRSIGDTTSDVSEQPLAASDNKGEMNDCYHGHTMGERKCVTGLEHQHNHFYLLVNRQTGRVKYACFSDRCSHTQEEGIVIGYVHYPLQPQNNRQDLTVATEDKEQSPTSQSDGTIPIDYEMNEASVRPLSATTSMANAAKRRMVVVKSAMGTAKTTKLFDHLSDLVRTLPDRRVLVISHRKCLASRYHRASKDLGFHLYSKEKNANMPTFQRLIIQYESLNKLVTLDDEGRSTMPEPYGLVVLDEVESTLTNVTCEVTNVFNMHDNAMAFANVLQEAQRIVALDADAALRCYEMARTMLGKGVPSVWWEVNRRLPRYRHILLYPDDDQWVAELTKLLRSGCNVCVCINSRARAKKLLGELSRGGLDLCNGPVEDKVGGLEGKEMAPPPPERRSVAYRYYSSEGHDLEQNKDFEDVDTAWSTLQLVMFTSKISCGLSFEVPNYFDCVFAYGSSKSCCPRVLHQMIGRIRSTKRPEIHFRVVQSTSKGRRGLIGDAMTLADVKVAVRRYRTSLRNHESIVIREFYKETEPLTLMTRKHWVISEDWLFEVLCHNILEENLARRDYTRCLAELCTGYGYMVSCVVSHAQASGTKKHRTEPGAFEAAEQKQHKEWFDAALLPLSAQEMETLSTLQRSDAADPRTKFILRKVRFQALFKTPITYEQFVEVNPYLLVKIHNVAAALNRSVQTTYLEERRRSKGRPKLAEVDRPCSHQLAFMNRLASLLDLKSPIDTETLVSDKHLRLVHDKVFYLLKKDAAEILEVDAFHDPHAKRTQSRKKAKKNNNNANRAETNNINILRSGLSKVWYHWAHMEFNVTEFSRPRKDTARSRENRLHRLIFNKIGKTDLNILVLARDTNYLSRLTDMGQLSVITPPL